MTDVVLARDAARGVVTGSAAVGLRAPTAIVFDVAATTATLTYTPNLTAAEQTLVDRLAKVTASAVSITPAEWQAIESDIANAKAYLAIASPTLVQTAAVSKSIIRVLAALLRS